MLVSADPTLLFKEMRVIAGRGREKGDKLMDRAAECQFVK